MNNTTALILIGLVVLSGAYFVYSTDSAQATGNVVNVAPTVNEGEVQKVVLGMKDYNYYPQTVRVKANQPVELSLDDSVYGCFRDFTIRDLGVRKYLAAPSDTVTFTPTAPGTYTFACSMNMGTGTLIVE